MSEKKTSLVGKPSQVYCEVCNVYVSSASLLPTHIKGKKHQSLQKVQEAQIKAAALSVYVTGLKCSETNEDEMSTFFSSFGKVTKIYFDKNKGVYAIVEFEDEKSISDILEKEEPIVFKGRHLKIKKRIIAKPTEKQETSKSPELNPKKRKKRCSSETKTSFLPKEIMDQLKQLDTVGQQIDLLMSELRLTEEDIQLRSLVCKVLEEVFKEFSPSVEVVPYGSSTSGLGCKGTDLDITILADKDILKAELDTKDSDAGGRTEAKGPKLYMFVVEVLRSVVPGCSHVIPISSAKCPVIKFTHQTSGLSCDLTVNNRLGIQNTKLLRCYMALDPRVAQLVFIIRAWAKSLGISGGDSGQLTSYALTLMVIYYLQTTNPPVIPSLQNISGWPMKDESEKVNEAQDCYIDRWDCSFFEDITRLSPSLNDKPVEKLLEEFFDFYGNKFDYGNCAVNIRKAERCTILSLEDELWEIESKRKHLEQTNESGSLSEDTTVSGMTPETREGKEDLDHKSSLAETSEEDRTKETGTAWKTTPICVQDPFELTHNVTQNIWVPSLRNIIHCMMHGYRVCSAFPSNGHLTESDGIAAFFASPTKTPTKRKKKESYSFSVYLCKKSEMDEPIPAGGIVCSKYSTPEELFNAICKYVEHDLLMTCNLEDKCGKSDSKGHLSATCTALTNTWTHCRRERRKIKGKEDLPAASEENKSHITLPESSMVQDSDAKTLKQGLTEAPPAHPEQGTAKNKPVLVFKLILSEKKDSLGGKSKECVVKLEHLNGTGLQTFENFYAFFKKQVQALFT